MNVESLEDLLIYKYHFTGGNRDSLQEYETVRKDND